jgi:uncharacterized alpha-E superfamily protein
MLARVANSLYWTGRYIERSEHLARYLRVQYFSTLDAPMTQNKAFILRSILNMYGIDHAPEAPVEEADVLFTVGMDNDNPLSIRATVRAARENARSLRYLLSTELWEAINEFYLFSRDFDAAYFQTRGLHDYTTKTCRHCSVIRSLLDDTLLHDEIWLFLKLGMHLERAAQVIRILHSKLHDIAVIAENDANIPLRQYQATITLKVLEGFDMHHRRYKKPLSPGTTVEFLITNPRFPRSVTYNLRCVHESLLRLREITPTSQELLFRAGKLYNYFRYLEPPEVKDRLNEFLEASLQQIYGLHELIEQEYFALD